MIYPIHRDQVPPARVERAIATLRSELQGNGQMTQIQSDRLRADLANLQNARVSQIKRPAYTAAWREAELTQLLNDSPRSRAAIRELNRIADRHPHYLSDDDRAKLRATEFGL